MLTIEQKKNLKLMAEAAVASEKATGCRAEVSVAQCILESGWLKVAPGNNCFGIKDTDRYPGAQYLFTKEYANGEWQTLKLAFEAYPTLADCFTDHARLITGGFIPPKKNCYGAAFEAYKLDGDLDKFIRGIAKYYATAPTYADQIIQLAHAEYVVDAVAAAREA
jgi:flagellum-specific peptidoglycan hydrolase FlgJ